MSRWTARARQLLRYGWALPATLPGLLLVALARALGADTARVDGVLEAGGGRLGHVAKRFCRFDAITLGHVVLAVDQRALVRHRAHELVHVRQYERWGVLFFPLYLGSSLWQWLRGRDPYRDNRFERQAYREAGA